MNTNEKLKQFIDENELENIKIFENDEYWKHIEYAEKINTLINCGKIISLLILVIISIILIVSKIKNKKNKKIILILFILFIIITIIFFLAKTIPV